ncbi:MAG: hypothetical protein U0736_27755 [Gemmataceae bacterium]
MRGGLARAAALLFFVLTGVTLFGGHDHPAPPAANPAAVPPYSAAVESIVADARAPRRRPPRRAVFASPTLACLSCHKVGRHGATVGPELSTVGKTAKPAEIVESVVWPKRQVKADFVAHAVQLSNGSTVQGYRDREDAIELAARPARRRSIASARTTSRSAARSVR